MDQREHFQYAWVDAYNLTLLTLRTESHWDISDSVLFPLPVFLQEHKKVAGTTSKGETLGWSHLHAICQRPKVTLKENKHFIYMFESSHHHVGPIKTFWIDLGHLRLELHGGLKRLQPQKVTGSFVLVFFFPQLNVTLIPRRGDCKMVSIKRKVGRRCVKFLFDKWIFSKEYGLLWEGWPVKKCSSHRNFSKLKKYFTDEKCFISVTSGSCFKRFLNDAMNTWHNPL